MNRQMNLFENYNDIKNGNEKVILECLKSKVYGSYSPCGAVTLCGTYKPKEGEDNA